MPGLRVGANRSTPVAHFIPGVRRHVLDVARCRHRIAEIVCAGQREFRLLAGFRRVDVEVACAGMRDVFVENACEHFMQVNEVRVVDITVTPPLLEQEYRDCVNDGDFVIAGVPVVEHLHA